MENAKKLKQLIEESDRILITSHIGPDPDAVSSVLLLGTTLTANYPNKKIVMVLEEKPSIDLSFLYGYGQIEFSALLKTLNDFNPDLFIIVDANTYKRVSRKDYEQLAENIVSQGVKTAIIDHHEFDGKENADVFINTKRPACAEEIYFLCFEELDLKQPEGFAQTALLGIVSDTQKYKFDHPGYRDSFRITANLIDAGASIERLESKLERFTKGEVEVIANLLSNINSQDGYTYSFIDDEFINNWQKKQGSDVDLKNAATYFVNTFVRSFQENNWGFLVYPDVKSGQNWWGVSFRSVSNAKDVSLLARQLGGGGHKPAAAAKFQAASATEAIAKVKDTIVKYNS